MVIETPCFGTWMSLSRDLLVNLEKWVSHKNIFFVMVLGGLGVSRRTAPTIRSYLQSFSRFGGTWDWKVHFSMFSGKLTFQCSRNGPQNHPFCPGSLQDTFIIYSSISHQHIFPKTKLDNRKSENPKTQVHSQVPRKKTS